MRRTERAASAYFFSEKLRRQLAQIAHYPLTVVEAPSGFGKTTAVREYLKENLPAGAQEFWYTCLGESAKTAWAGICGLLARVDEEAAERLGQMDMPTIDTLGYLEPVLRGVRCETETYLVVDNYQLVGSEIPRELVDAFSLHENRRLHLVFITQQLETRRLASVHNDNVYIVDSSAFFFDREGTFRLFRMEGIRLSESELDSVCSGTEGWVSAIRLQLVSYRTNGSFASNAGIERLVETAVWDRLTPEERAFLLSVSVLDSFSPRQAAMMCGEETLTERIENLLNFNDFIRYDSEKGVYLIHSILRDYLLNRFFNYQSEADRQRMLRRAGEACAAASQYYPAARFFFVVGAFDALLSLPFRGPYLDDQKENAFQEFIQAVVDGCPEETLCRYPLTLVIFGYRSLMHGQMELYARLCRLIERMLWAGAGPREKGLREIEGEYALLRSLEHFNDIPGMEEGQGRAWELMGKPTGIIGRDAAWVFGTVSVLYAFWREPGGLERALEELDRALPSYLRLTRGHGSGANSVMRAEALLMRGEDKEAEILCHKAAYDARGCEQTGVCISADLVLVRIAILRGDVRLYFAAVNRIRLCGKDDRSLNTQRMAELSLSAVSLALGDTEHVAEWLRTMEGIERTLYTPIVPYAQMLHLKLLLLEKRYNELFGIASTLLDRVRNASGNARFVLFEVYLHLYLALASHESGADRQAADDLGESLALALPDRVFLPFAQRSAALPLLLERAGQTVCDKKEMNAMLALAKRQAKGREAIRRAILASVSPLTPREREVALLARERLSTREIAGQLYISEGTVRNILNRVYDKLDIHSKSQLRTKKF